MLYSENKEQAGEYLRSALNNITKYGLAATPLNYTVWYEYASGKNNNLTKAIDYVINNNKTFDNGVLKQFYQAYIIDGHRAVTAKALSEIKNIITDISSCVVDAKGEFIGHDNKLQSISMELNKADDFYSLNVILDKMTSEIKNIMQSGKNLNGRMAESSEELESLRKKLEKAQQASETDVLTGLANRRKFEKALDCEIKKAVDNKNSLSLIMADIDFFKRINDTFGHLTGDSVLKAIAALFKRQLKGKDLASRFGGEEFIPMLPETNLENACAVAENLRSALAGKAWKQKASGKSMGKITISLGVVQYKKGESKKSFIERVDKALYFAKQNGRNRVASEKDLESR